MYLSSILSVFGIIQFAIARPTVYFVRHGEKPKNGGLGLSEEGLQRAQCLRRVFGTQSEYNIGYIMAQRPNTSMESNWKRTKGPQLD